MRLVFIGTPQFAVPSLAALVGGGHEIALVVTQPDRPGRHGQRPVPPPVAAFAAQHQLPLWQTGSLRGEEAEARLRAAGAEAMALAAYAALVPRNVLDLSRHGVLNVHPSLLPRWRGAAPIQAALLAGDTTTGVSIIRLVARMDAGPILLQEALPIQPEDDATTLEPRLATLGAGLLVRALSQLEAEALIPHAQDEPLATYCQKIDREDGRIDWNEPAERIWRQVRAYRSWPGAFTTWEGKLLKIGRAAPSAVTEGIEGKPGLVVKADDQLLVGTGDPATALRLDEVTLEGKRPQSGGAFLRGYPRLVGARLGA